MTFLLRLAALLRQAEARHWVALGSSALLHVAVFLGLRQEPAPLPETVSFEVNLQAPEELLAKRPKTQALAAKSSQKAKRPKPAKAKKPPRKAEPHTLEAQFKPERKTPRDAPKVALPDSEAVTPEAAASTLPQAAAEPVREAATQPGTRPALAATSAAGAAQPNPATAAAVASEFSLAGAAGMVAGGSAATAGEQGLTLAASRSMALAPGGGDAPQGAEASKAQGSDAQGASAGPGTGSFSASATSGGGLNLAAGSGAQASSSSASAPLAGGEPQGLRLTASGTLSSLPEFTQGQGGLASGQLAQDAGAATPVDGPGQGQNLASAKAGGASASPLAGPVPGPGKGGQGEAVERVAQTGPAGGGPAPGRLAGAPTAARSLGGERPGRQRAGNASQSGKTLALAPGEPGSGPQWAVLMLPVQTGVPLLAGTRPGGTGKGGGQQASSQARTAPSGGDETEYGARAGGSRLAQTAGGGMEAVRPRGMTAPEGSVGGRLAAPAQAPGIPGGARADGHAQVMSAIQPAQRQLVKADSRVDKLDVLAPSNYCPLPIHAQPDNRPPAARQDQLELPSYANSNPSFTYPVMANVYGVEGKVTMRVEVRADGTPGKMWVKESSGHGILDRDAGEQLARWRFNPARKGGQAVAAWIDVPVIYRLPEGRK